MFRTSSRTEGTVPFAVECAFRDVQLSHLLVSDLNSLRIEVSIRGGFALQPSRVWNADQIDNRVESIERFAAPVAGNVAEHLMLDLVPLARAGRERADADPQPRFVGQGERASGP